MSSLYLMKLELPPLYPASVVKADIRGAVWIIKKENFCGLSYLSEKYEDDTKYNGWVYNFVS